MENFIFNSSSHIRYENGRPVSGLRVYASRSIKVESDTRGKDGYILTIFNNEGNHPLHGNNMQMAPKPMKVISSSSNKTELRGFGADPRLMGNPVGNYSNYGITIFHTNNSIDKIILHLHDRNIELEYFK